ncbi:MAG: phosphate/phosphite/phosphonate ABC transporter substrate-binding protein [Rhodospirillales bacterium]|jgi:phosphonate transport system substrate-binding protein|nr:phosphate/phosphite/phosphonate ABC transporter substrate-binding protein [Rhodospirillales bacterium]MDP6884721.1 phosphate/phosphite/phosphonate ABC transporter substrate-binding protein [Rhodospirillales bacterium]
MRARLLSILALIAPLFISPVWAAETAYRFGVVPQFEPRKLAGIWVPIIKELEKRTRLEFKMVGSSKIPDFEVSFLAGEFDFAYMNPYHAMLAAEKQGYVPLVRDGGRELFGILVLPKDSPIQDVKELAGKIVAFPAPNALGASLLIRADLETIHGVKVKPLYVQTHSSVYLNVILNKTAAGGGVQSTLNSQKKEIQDRLRVFYKTRAMAPHPLTAHPRVPRGHREAVKQALLEMAANEEGRALLEKIPMLEAVAANPKDYRVLKDWGLEHFYEGH